ncbi:MAG: type II secretion system protein, partial [Alphaproteobacteria bacterium]|nr:type II secretion system protein [Alphaproteobacteria bacterium]
QVSNDVYNQRYTSEKVASRSKQSGRSMIEMLGVLAIIGVLTVGLITAYSHAMHRHLLNKQREQINYILSAVETHREMLDTSPNSTLPRNLKPIFETLGWIPEEMIRENDNAYIYTIFGNRSFIQLNPPSSGHDFYYLSLRIFINHYNAYEQCVNLFQLAKNFHATLWLAEVESRLVNNRRGDKYCTSADCLRNTTPADIAKFCQLCKDQNKCNVYYHWR